MDYPRISIVTPSFNQGAYLEETILSVLQQDYPNLEYLIIDGGSTDESVAILEKYRDRLAYVCSEADDGQAHAIAKGFERARGEIFFWLGSDDLLLPGALKRVAEYFQQHPDCQVLNGGCVFIDAEGAVLKEALLPFSLGVQAKASRFRYYEQDGVCQPATFWKAELYRKVGGVNPERQFIMDLDLFARMAEHAPFHQLPEFLSCFRLHQESKSSTLQHVRQREFEELAQQTGRYVHGALFAKLMYWRYRIPSLIRKGALYLLWQLRVIQLRTVSYVGHSAHNRKAEEPPVVA